MRSVLFVSFVAALTASLVAALPVQAQENGTQSDQVFINGNLVLNVVEATNTSEFFPAFYPASGLPSVAVVLYEDPSQSVVSDQLYVQNQYFYFASDPDLQDLTELGIPVVGSLVENGTPQDVSGYFGLPSGTVLVESDVPEPGTMALVGLGIVGLAAIYRRRTAKA